MRMEGGFLESLDIEELGPLPGPTLCPLLSLPAAVDVIDGRPVKAKGRRALTEAEKAQRKAREREHSRVQQKKYRERMKAHRLELEVQHEALSADLERARQRNTALGHANAILELVLAVREESLETLHKCKEGESSSSSKEEPAQEEQRVLSSRPLPSVLTTPDGLPPHLLIRELLTGMPSRDGCSADAPPHPSTPSSRADSWPGNGQPEAGGSDAAVTAEVGSWQEQLLVGAADAAGAPPVGLGAPGQGGGSGGSGGTRRSLSRGDLVVLRQLPSSLSKHGFPYEVKSMEEVLAAAEGDPRLLEEVKNCTAQQFIDGWKSFAQRLRDIVAEYDLTNNPQVLQQLVPHMEGRSIIMTLALQHNPMLVQRLFASCAEHGGPEDEDYQEKWDEIMEALELTVSQRERYLALYDVYVQKAEEIQARKMEAVRLITQYLEVLEATAQLSACPEEEFVALIDFLSETGHVFTRLQKARILAMSLPFFPDCLQLVQAAKRLSLGA